MHPGPPGRHSRNTPTTHRNSPLVGPAAKPHNPRVRPLAAPQDTDRKEPPSHVDDSPAPAPYPPQPLHRQPEGPEALDARDALAEALTRAGIQLPAMDVRTPWFEPEAEPERDDAPASTRYALVYLGVCSAPVALALAAVIAKGAGQ